MVNHRQSVESQAIPQWRNQYIEYGELSDLLSTVVSKVRLRFEVHARKSLQVFHQPKGNVRRNKCETEEMEEQPTEDTPFIVLEDMPAHRNFEKQLVLEISKASCFYNNKILDIKFEMISLLIVAIKLGLIDEFELANEIEGNYDPGSTIGILTREIKGLNVVLSAKDDPLRNKRREQDGKVIHTSFEEYEDDIKHQSRILFVATNTDHGKIGSKDKRRKMIEDWLMSTSLTISPSSSSPSSPNKRSSNLTTLNEDINDNNETTPPFYVTKWEENDNSSSSKRRRSSYHHTADLIGGFKRDMLEFYRQLVLILEYGEQNSVSIHKILKKHRKELGGHIHKSETIANVLHACPFHNDGEHEMGNQLLLKHLISQTQALYISSFWKDFDGDAGDKKKAGMRELSGFQTDGKETEWFQLFQSLRFGIMLGSAFILVCIILYVNSFETVKCQDCEDVIVGLYRLTGMAIVFAWMWAIVSTVVIAVRIDYSMVLQYDPRVIGRASENFFDGLCVFTLIWLFALSLTMFYLKSAPHWFSIAPTPIYPIILFFMGCGVVAFHEKGTGGWFLTAVRNIVTAPLHIVTFKDIFLADQFTSLVIILRDFLFMGCFLAQGGVSNEAIREDGVSCIGKTNELKPLFASLPSLWRFFQCLRRYRDSCKTKKGNKNDDDDDDDKNSIFEYLASGEKVHLYNAIKYSMTFPLITLSTLSAQTSNSKTIFYLDLTWYFFAVIDVTYKCYWDFIHDWGLGSFDNKFLRPRMVVLSGDVELLRPIEANHLYPIRNYYFCMFTNFCMRSTSPLLVSSSFLGTSTGSTCIAVLEVVRRGVWNCFRLENRHLTHCMQQRTRLMDRLEHFDRKLGKDHDSFNRFDMFKQLASLAEIDMTSTSSSSSSSSSLLPNNRFKNSPRKNNKAPHLGDNLPPFLSDEWLAAMHDKVQEKQHDELGILSAQLEHRNSRVSKEEKSNKSRSSRSSFDALMIAPGALLNRITNRQTVILPKISNVKVAPAPMALSDISFDDTSVGQKTLDSSVDVTGQRALDSSGDNNKEEDVV